MRLPRRSVAPFEPAPGERVLAWAETDLGPVGGTRDALYLPTTGETVRMPWHEVETADWDQEAGALVVRGVGTWGEVRPEHHYVVAEPGRLLELLRERVTASIALTRHALVQGDLGVKVIGRRPSSGDRAVVWFVEYDAGLDPADPLVETTVQDVLAGARAEVGES